MKKSGVRAGRGLKGLEENKRQVKKKKKIQKGKLTVFYAWRIAYYVNAFRRINDQLFWHYSKNYLYVSSIRIRCN